MGSSLKLDSDRRELLRERRAARIERKQQRRQAREDKRLQTGEPLVGLSAAQRIAEQDVRRELDRIVDAALDRHDSPPANETQAMAPPAAGNGPTMRATGSGPRSHAERRAESQTAGEKAPSPAGMAAERRVSRLERDIAEFRARRRSKIKTARGEAKGRIVRAGETAAISDALAAVDDPSASVWRAEREQLEQALASGRITEVGAAGWQALRSVSRDAARTSRRITHDPDVAYAVCVAYAIIGRLPGVAIQVARQRRREKIAMFARREALQRISREGGEHAVSDALAAVEQARAALDERLSAAIAGRGIAQVRAAARRGWQEAAADAARTSRCAPDRELAHRIAVAYAVIAEAPWAAVHGWRAERNGTARHAASRPVWRSQRQRTDDQDSCWAACRQALASS